MYKFLLIISLILFSCSGLFSQSANRKMELNSIGFEGNSQFSNSQLRLVIYSQESPIWIWKFLDSFTSFGKAAIYFDSSIVKGDITPLKEFYVTNGFFNAQVSCVYTVDTASRKVDVVFKIVEGAPSNFGRANLIGLIAVTADTYKNIQENFSIDTSKRFSQTVIQTNIDKIVSNLKNNGYKNAKLDSAIVFKDTLYSRADVNIYFTPGDRYSISDVYVVKNGVGSASVEDTLLTQVVGIHKGELYSLEKLKRSQIRLFRTGLFSSISVGSPTKDSLMRYAIPIEINGTIGSMNDLSPEVIVNDQQNFSMGLAGSYTRKNFLGQARKFTTTTSFGMQDPFKAVGNLSNNFSVYDNKYLGYADARMTVEQPFIFDRPITGILEIYGTLSKTTAVNTTKYGSKVSFEFEMPEYTFLSYLSTYYNLEINNEFDYTGNEVTPTKRTLSVIGADLRSSLTDNPLFPTSGRNTSLVVEQANGLSYLAAKLTHNEYKGAMFYKILATNANYFPLNKVKNAILGLKFKIGHIQTYSGNIYDIPYDRKFYVGGSNSLRGWKATDTVMMVYATKNITDSVIKIYGGTFIMEGSAELRYKFLDNVGVAVFSDYGGSWLKYDKFRFDKIAVDVGFGLRYYTSIAPFRIDFGYKIYDPNDSRSILKKQFLKTFLAPTLQFGIGEAF